MIVPVAAIDLEVSLDNTTWTNATKLCNSEKCRLVGLESGKLYYIRIRETGDPWQYLDQRTEERDRMALGIFALLPFLFGVALLMGVSFMDERHNPLKIFVLLLLPICFWASMHLSITIAVEVYEITALSNLLGTTVYWTIWVFFILLMYFLIYLFFYFTHVAAQEKKARLEY